MLNTNQSNVLKILEDLKDFDGNDLSNKIKNYNTVELHYMETQHLIKVIEKGASHIKEIVLINCYCDLKLLSKFKKLSHLRIYQAFDYLHGQKIYRDKSYDSIMKKWLKKNKWFFRNVDKTKAYYAIHAKESIENKFKNDLGGFLKSTDLILSDFPNNFNKKIYNFKWSPFFEPSINNFPFYFSGKDFESLGKLINLKVLSLEVDDSVNLSFIKKLKKIKELYIRFTQENVNEINLKNILPKSQNLETLMIDGIYQNYDLPNSNIQFLSNYKKLNSLTLHSYSNYINIKTIKNLKTYKHINILDYLIVDNMNELFSYKKLEVISRIKINNCDNLELLCEFLKDITCYSLIIDNLSKTTTLSPISKLNKLSSFHIWHSENSINNLHHVRFSRNLIDLSLSNIVLDNVNSLKINKKQLTSLMFRDSKIYSIDGLANYKKLHTLSLSLFNNNYNLRFLSKLSLETLSLQSINNFDFVKSLPKLKTLKRLHLESISLSKYNKLTEREKIASSKTPDGDTYGKRFDRFFNNYSVHNLSEEQTMEMLQMAGKEKLDFITKMPNLEKLTIKAISIKDLIPLEKLDKLVELNLFAVDNSTLMGIGNIKNLKYLDLSYNFYVSDKYLFQLTNLKKLKEFKFYYSGMYSSKRYDDFFKLIKENDKKNNSDELQISYKDEHAEQDQYHSANFSPSIS